MKKYTFQKFIRFIKENNVYDKYKNNVINDKCLISELKKFRMESYISGAFDWLSSKEGIDFWVNMNDKWLNFSSKKINNF